MTSSITLDDITIRTDLQPGDIGSVTYLHGTLYSKEYQYGIAFESYVASGLHEFYKNYDRDKDRVWVCEHNQEIVGFLLLMHHPQDVAQLRYFILKPAYRKIGLGRKLMTLFMQSLKALGYKRAFLWTTNELYAAAYLYKRAGFVLTEEKDSTVFGKPVKEQRYDLIMT